MAMNSVTVPWVPLAICVLFLPDARGGMQQSSNAEMRRRTAAEVVAASAAAVAATSRQDLIADPGDDQHLGRDGYVALHHLRATLFVRGVR